MPTGIQISAVVTKDTKALLEQFVRATGVKKGHVIEVALRHHLVALQELPADAIIPPRLVVSAFSGKEIAKRILSPGRATTELQELMSGHADKAARRRR